MAATTVLAALLDTAGPPPLGPGPRPGVQDETSLQRAIDQALASSPLASERQQLLRALVLLWHDHLDSAHTIAQAVDNADGAFVHGIMHRREPDYGNASYWFRRVGAHPCFEDLAKRVSEFVEKEPQAQVPEPLLARGQWDPFAFIRACERGASRPPTDPLHQSLRYIQGLESRTLLDWLATSE